MSPLWLCSSLCMLTWLVGGQVHPDGGRLHVDPPFKNAFKPARSISARAPVYHVAAGAVSVYGGLGAGEWRMLSHIGVDGRGDGFRQGATTLSLWEAWTSTCAARMAGPTASTAAPLTGVCRGRQTCKQWYRVQGYRRALLPPGQRFPPSGGARHPPRRHTCCCCCCCCCGCPPRAAAPSTHTT